MTPSPERTGASGITGDESSFAEMSRLGWSFFSRIDWDVPGEGRPSNAELTRGPRKAHERTHL